MLLMILGVSFVLSPCETTEYFVRPTQPTNSSCPGSPCLTLAQYINEADRYFKSVNNSIFLFLSGTHNISLPVTIADSYNITLKNYEKNETPSVVLNSDYVCVCEFRFVCQKCSAIQFHNTSSAVVKGIDFLVFKLTHNSSVNGLAFNNCDSIVLEDFSVTVKDSGDGYCLLHRVNIGYTTLCGCVFLEETTETMLYNATLNFSPFIAYSSHNIVLENVRLNGSHEDGVKAVSATSLILQDVEVVSSRGHCIRLKRTHNTYITNSRLLDCGNNGIHGIMISNTAVEFTYFNRIFSKALYVEEKSINMNVRNSIIKDCKYLCIYIIHSVNITIENVTATDCDGVWGTQIQGTSFLNFSLTSSVVGLVLFDANDTVVKHSYLELLESSAGSVSLKTSYGTVLSNAIAGSSLAMQNCQNTTFDRIEVRNVTKMPALVVYQSVNTTIKHTNFNSFSGGNSVDYPAVVLAYKSVGIYIENCVFSRNTLTALKAFDSSIIVSGSVMFANNTASVGAAVMLQQSSVITVTRSSHLIFISNHATFVGGAIYVDTNTFYQSTDTGNIDLASVCMLEIQDDARIQFINNSGESGGDVVYGGHMGIASAYDGSNCLKTFKQVSIINQTNTMSTISSQPSRVCVCDSTGHPDCLKIFHRRTLYPGESVSLWAVVVGQDFGTGTGSVYGQFQPSEQTARLEEWQYSQKVTQTHCNPLNYTILSAPTDSAVLVLTAVEMTQVQPVVTNSTVQTAIEGYNAFVGGNGSFPQPLLTFPVYINISIQQCPLGFSLTKTPYRCKCNSLLSQLPGVECYIENRSFKRSGTSWIGLRHDKDITVSQYCLPFFCEVTVQNVTVNDLEHQCKNNRSGVLCSRCQNGLSVALGSYRCLHCSNSNISLILLFALAGIILVLGIKTLDITVARGCINGLVLYFNLLKPALSVMVPQDLSKVLFIVISWVNLDFGFETCFFDGLTMYWSMWLQFLFPLYIWTISGAIIFLARYSTKLAKLMGSNPVAVLATLFLLSYTKLMHLCIIILSYSVVTYPKGTKTVWSFDGDMEYLGPEHLPLFAVAVVVLVFLCIPYTMVLLLGQWLCRCKNRYVSRTMFKLKPFMDAYYGPLKDKHRYWVGLLLLSRALIHVSLDVAPNVKNTSILLALCLLSVFLLQLNAYVMGFYRNWYVSAFEITIISNFTLYTLTRLYIAEKMQVEAALLVDNLFTAAGIAQLCLLILYRIFVLLKHNLSCCTTLLSHRTSIRDYDEHNWEAYEEASPLREPGDAGKIAADEMIPIAINSLPSYGI